LEGLGCVSHWGSTPHVGGGNEKIEENFRSA